METKESNKAERKSLMVFSFIFTLQSKILITHEKKREKRKSEAKPQNAKTTEKQ
jgi:hypothetical protein